MRTLKIIFYSILGFILVYSMMALSENSIYANAWRYESRTIIAIYELCIVVVAVIATDRVKKKKGRKMNTKPGKV